MAELIRGDSSKGIKNVGELALRISKFDSYRLFTLYENTIEKKVMDLSGGAKYYLVFKSTKKEIRIPEYETNGFFEVDKVNGCLLFKISKKNAEDILSMRTAGERVFHIIRVFEERDLYGRLLSVTDEVEVYNGKWGDDLDFSAYSLENKIDLLTKALAAQVDKNAKLLNDYNELLELYNNEVNKNATSEKEIETLRAETESLQTTLTEYLGDTYDGTVLSTNTKYIALESTLENISFTEEQYSNALNELMTKGEVNLTDIADTNDPRVDIKVEVSDDTDGLEIRVYRNDEYIGSAVYDEGLYKNRDADSGDVFKFVFVGMSTDKLNNISLVYEPAEDRSSEEVFISKPQMTSIDNIIHTDFSYSGNNNLSLGDISIDTPLASAINLNSVVMTATIKYNNPEDVDGNIGTFKCYI